MASIGANVRVGLKVKNARHPLQWLIQVAVVLFSFHVVVD